MLKATMKRYKNVTSLILLAASIIIFMPSCVKKQLLRTTALRTLAEKPDYESTQRTITLRVKKLTDQETGELFNGHIPHTKTETVIKRSDGRARKKSVHVALDTILLSVVNKSNSTVQLNKENIGLPLVDHNTMFFVKNSSRITAKTIGIGLAALVGIPAIVFCGSIAIMLSGPSLLFNALAPAFIYIGALPSSACGTMGGALGTMIAFPLITTAKIGIPLGITGAVGTCLWTNTNIAQTGTCNNQSKITITDTITIEPQQSRQLLLFVRKDASSKDFALTVNENQTSTSYARFTVTLP